MKVNQSLNQTSSCGFQDVQHKVARRKDTVDHVAPSQPSSDGPSAVKTSWHSFLADAKVPSLSGHLRVQVPPCACMLNFQCANPQGCDGVGAGRGGVSRNVEVHGDVCDHCESQADF